MNLPTKITCIRIAMIPLMLLFFCLKEIFAYYYIPVAIIFFLAGVTDYVDGYIARKYNMVTDLGKFLDPIADKILVVAGLIVLLGDYALYGVSVYVLVIGTTLILAREFIIGVFRQLAASKGCVLAADKMGKIKTMATLSGITWLLISPLQFVDIVGWKYFGLIMFYAGYVAFVFAVVMTIVSGVNYVVKNKTVLRNVD